MDPEDYEEEFGEEDAAELDAFYRDVVEFTYDPSVDAFYLYLRDREEPVHHTIISTTDESVLLDINEEGTVVGIEIIGLKAKLDAIEQDPE